jgi:hypothetical protein
MMKDFIPASEGDFLTFERQFASAAEEQAGLLGIPAAAITTLKTLQTAYETAHTACESPNAGKVDRESRKEKRAALTGEIRLVKRAYIDANPLGAVTDEIRLSFGLPPADHNRSPVPVPAEEVVFTLENSSFLQIAVRHPAKPPRFNGAVALYMVGGPEPVSRKDLSSSKLLTRPHEVLTFDETDQGRTLHIALRWQNEKGELGPWPPIQSIVIR